VVAGECETGAGGLLATHQQPDHPQKSYRTDERAPVLQPVDEDSCFYQRLI
jgi:hypothetical protein